MVTYPVGFGVASNAPALTRAEVRAQLTFEHAEATRGEMPEYPVGISLEHTRAPLTRAQVNQELAEAVTHPAYQNVETDYPGPV